MPSNGRAPRIERWHYSDSPIAFDAAHIYAKPSGIYKPKGFWWSVGDDWARWCRAEEFGVGGLAYRTPLVIDESRLLKLRDAGDIDHFGETYRDDQTFLALSAPGLGLHEIDWLVVARDYAGIEIAPYCLDRRYVTWYYPWDCASGVAWDLSIVRAGRSCRVKEPSHAS